MSLRLSGRDACVSAYPDHVQEPGRAPLAALADFVADHLAPAITGVHTLPIHPSSGDGGFSVLDPDAVDPRFGTWDDVRRLAGGTTWVADFVVNHLSAGSEWFRRFLAGDAEFARFFVTLPPGTDTSAVVRPRTTPLSHRFESAAGPVDVWTTFSADQVDLDYTNPAVLAAMDGVLERYVDAGAGAVRLDAVAFLAKDPSGPSIHLSRTHAIVAHWRRLLDEIAPDVVLVTETNVPHAENVTYFGTAEQPEADAVYQFALAPLVAFAVRTGDTAPLVAWAGSTEPAPPGKTFLNVLASHDGIGLRPAEGLLTDAQISRLCDDATRAGGVVNKRGMAGCEVPYELAISWFALMAGDVDEDEAIARHIAAHAVALALPGIPLLYLNSLFGMGNDDATYAATGHARDLNRRRHRRGALDAALADRTSRATKVWAALRDLLERRAGDPNFHPQDPVRILDAPPGEVIIERGPSGAATTVRVQLAPPYAVIWPAR